MLPGATPTMLPGARRGREHRSAACNTGVVLLVAAMLMLLSMAYLAWVLYQGTSASRLSSSTGATQLPAATIQLVAKALDPEVMQHGLPAGASMDAGYKNPCWRDGEGQLRCLPAAYIMGSFQSGVNTLFHKISEHPDIITNDVSRWQFWGEDYKKMSEYVTKHSTGRTAKELAAAPQRKIILDGSASTFAFYWSAGLRAHRAFQSVMVPCWQECSKQSAGSKEAQRACLISQCFPRSMAADIKVAEGLGVSHDALHLPLIMRAAYGSTYSPKLIVLLRDPLTRLHCAYWTYGHYHNKYGKTADGFLHYVKEQVGALKECAQQLTGQTVGAGAPMTRRQAERHCALYFEALGPQQEQLFFHADQVIRGMYSIFLEVWLRHFPRHHMLIVKSEDYFQSNTAVVEQVQDFLGLEPPTDPKVTAKMTQAGVPAPCTKDAPAMLPEARQILLDLYRPYNKELAHLLKDDRWLKYNEGA